MSVRARFKVREIVSSMGSRRGPDVDGRPHFVPCEMRTVVLDPVYSTNLEDENHKFWDATPTGEIRLGTINAEAWKYFELGSEYYIDFTKAE